MRPVAGPVRLPHRLGSLDRGVLEALLAPRRAALDVVPVGLLTRIDAHPSASALRSALADAADIELEVHHLQLEAPYRGSAVDAARLLEDGVRVIVADLPHSAVRRLAPLCAQYGAALLVTGTGAEPEVPGVLYLTEQRPHAARVLGGWTAQRLAGALFQVVAAPDAEFEVVEALREGFVAAGGEVVGLATTHDRATGTGADEAALAVRLSGARTVAVHASPGRAAELLRAIRAIGADVDVVVDLPDADDRELRALGHRRGELYAATSGSPDSVAADVARAITTGAALLSAESRPWSHLADVLAAAGDIPCRPVEIRRSANGRLSVVARR